MILISHRGNVNGPDFESENKPEYIMSAIDQGYDVEIDIWMIEGLLFLGHDKPQYGVTQDWLNKMVDKLWIHCKNIEAVEWFTMVKSFNYFWHEEDTITLTSKGYIWVYPGKQPVKNSIAVKPELHNDSYEYAMGVCSDYIEKYQSYG
jgi:hypothetical protein